MNTPALLLFDLGGVLVENRIFQRLKCLAPEILDTDALKDRWLQSPSVRQFELGRSTAQVFARDFIAEWELSLSPEAFLIEFTSWPKGFYPQAQDLLRHLRTKFRVGCLSNANVLFWERFDGFKADFDIALSSHLLGAIKPDQEAFSRALHECGVVPQEVCFFDDCPTNVSAAQKTGLRAFHTDGFDALQKTLRRELLL